MQEYLNQAEHNKNFHKSICDNFPETYNDWKLTIVFYKALHYLKAFIKDKANHVCHTHEEVDRFVNPDSNSPKLPISKTAWRNYKNLYTYSRTARYDGMINKHLFESQYKKDHDDYALNNLFDLKKYLVSRGLKIEDINSKK